MARWALKIACAAAVAGGTPSLGYADWQYTRWGMAPADVVQVSEGQVRLATKGEQTKHKFPALGLLGALGQHRIGGISTTALFYFEAAHLANIRIIPKTADDAFAIHHRLAGVYGEPIQRIEGKQIAHCLNYTGVWRSPRDNILVTSNIMNCNPGPGAFAVLYQPIPDTANSGL